MLAVWFFVITFASGGVQVQRFATEDACTTAREFMVQGLASQAPVRSEAETVTVTPCAFGEPPG